MDFKRRAGRVSIAVAIVACAVVQAACAGNRAPVLVAQSGLAIADSIGVVQVKVRELVDAKAITPAQALPIQQALVAVNDRLKPLPAILRTIDRLQATDQSTVGQVEQAIAILEIVGQDVSVVIAGVPISDATKALAQVVREAQSLVQSTLLEVAKLRAD